MGPRSEDRGDERKLADARIIFKASMGPRSEDRGDGCNATNSIIDVAASMGPRSEDRGDGRRFRANPFQLGCGFNGSTVRGPW